MEGYCHASNEQNIQFKTEENFNCTRMLFIVVEVKNE
jgi:hypothetical protein